MSEGEPSRPRSGEAGDAGRLVELKRADGGPGGDDPRRRIIERVIRSRTFERTQRLQDLLQYLAEHSLRRPDEPIREQAVGHAVFGRPREYDTSQDNLVRVQASKLRKRLNEYFAGEGADEPEIVELPPGGYGLVFRERPGKVPDPTQAEVSRLAEERRRQALTWALALALAAVSAAAIWLLARNAELARRAGPASSSRPLVERFWGQALGGDAPPQIVLSDGNMTLFQDLLGRRLTLPEYRYGQGLPSKIGPGKFSDEFDRVSGWVMSHHFVAFSEVTATVRILDAARAAGVRPDVRFARMVTSELFTEGAAVLMGNSRVNPWVSLFDESRAFRFGFDTEGSRNRAYFTVTAPRENEQARYEGRWSRYGYCVIAYLPNLDRTGNVVIIEGTDTASTGAGGEMLTNEKRMEEVWRLLAPAGTDFPYFEILLKTHLVDRRADLFSIEAHRVPAVR